MLSHNARQCSHFNNLPSTPKIAYYGPTTFVQHSRQDPGKAKSVREGSEGIKASPLPGTAASLSSLAIKNIPQTHEGQQWR